MVLASMGIVESDQALRVRFRVRRRRWPHRCPRSSLPPLCRSGGCAFRCQRCVDLMGGAAVRRLSKTRRSEQNERPITRSETGARGIPIVPAGIICLTAGPRPPARWMLQNDFALAISACRTTGQHGRGVPEWVLLDAPARSGLHNFNRTSFRYLAWAPPVPVIGSYPGVATSGRRRRTRRPWL